MEAAENGTGRELERGESRPLLDKRELLTQDGSLDIHGRPALRDNSGNWRAGCVLLGVVSLESCAYYGLSSNLVTYLNKILHEGNASIASSISTWTGTSLLTPILGALIADSYLGRYLTVFISGIVYMLGMIVVTLSASLSFLKPPACGGISCPPATEPQKLVFFSGLYLIALASGCVKSSLLPLGGDQFDDADPNERERKGSFFNWFYFSINVGALIGSTFIVWMQQEVGWAVGFAIATLSLCLAVGSFLSGTFTYRLQRPTGSPLKRVVQVLVASLRKIRLEVPADNQNLFEMEADGKNLISSESRKLLHTNEFRFLDKAAVLADSDGQDGCTHNPWRLCTVTQVEEMKILIRLLPMWITSIIYSIAYAQIFTTFLEQGLAMDVKIGAFSVPPAWLFAFEVLSVIFWILIYDNIIARWITSTNGVSQLVRMGIGRFLMILTMSMAALLEMGRLASVKAGKNISIAWQLPQYFVMGASEVFNYIAQLEFFYRQAPDSMRTLCTAASLLTLSVASYLSSFFVGLITFVTSRGGQPGWIPDNLNDGHLDYFFWTLSGLSIVNLILYVACARNYTFKRGAT